MQFNIQRLKKSSNKLENRGLAILGNRQMKNNLSFIYNDITSPYDPYVYTGDGVYIGNNPVASTTRIFYTKDIETSKVYHDAQYQTTKSGLPRFQAAGTADDMGILHIIMPYGTDAIKTDLNFRSLKDASISFGDVNRVWKWSHIRNDVSSWIHDTSFGGTETHSRESSVNIVYAFDSSSLRTAELWTASTTDGHSAGILFDYSNEEEYFDGEEGTFIDETYGKSNEDLAELSENYMNSLSEVGSIKNSVINFSDAWTKTLTNAYSGIISNIKWRSRGATEQNNNSGGYHSIDNPEPLLGAGEEEAYHGHLPEDFYEKPTQENHIREIKYEYASITDKYTYTVDKLVADGLAELVADHEDTYISEDGKKQKVTEEYTEDNNYAVYTFNDLFKGRDTSSNTAIAYTGGVVTVDNRKWTADDRYEGHTDASANVDNAGDAIENEVYRPTNVWDEINHRFEIIEHNFNVLTGDIAQTNIMLMEDTVGKLIPALVATNEKNISILSSDVSLLRADVSTLKSSMESLILDVSALDASVNAIYASIAGEPEFNIIDLDEEP